MIASYVKALPGFTGDARLYRCDPPLDGHGYVVVSAVNAMYTGPETYIFPSDPNGRVTDWGRVEWEFPGQPGSRSGADERRILRERRRVMPVPRSPLEGRYLTRAEFALVQAKAGVTIAQLRGWQRRHACLNAAVEKRIDAAVAAVVAMRGETRLEDDDG